MGEKFKHFVEEYTESKYVPFGATCDLCGRKLGFFATGFWSCNTKQLSDGAVCSRCAKKLTTLVDEMEAWMPKALLRKWQNCTKHGWQSLSLEQARKLLALKEQNGKDTLNTYGSGAQALLKVQEAFQIEPKVLNVGMARVKKLQNRTVVYGRMDMGALGKGDSVRIDQAGELIETSILEAYGYDPDVPENDFERSLRAYMGKQRLEENQLGWLILDYQGDVFPGDRIVK